MNRIYKNSLYMLAAGALAVSCADYNSTDNFTAEPDPTFAEPYKDLAPVKSYIDRVKYPNMTIGATLDVAEFNKQALAHSAAVTNFDNFAFGKTLMSGSIVNEKGVMNFLAMSDLLDHVTEIGAEVFGSPICANTNQADAWINHLTSPIEISVDYVPGKSINYNEYAVGAFGGTVDKGSASIVKFDSQNTLKIGASSQVNIIEGFDVDPTATYTIKFYAMADKDVSYSLEFSGNAVPGTATSDGKWALSGGKWLPITIESKAAEGSDGYLKLTTLRGVTIYIKSVEVGYYPDNHRPQTDQERSDTIKYALNTWCDGLMKINAGRIKTFDLIEEAISTDSILENGMYALKSYDKADKVYWQDVLGSEEYAPTVAKVAREAYARYGNDPAELKFYVSETGLEDETKMASLNYWLGIWDAKGAKIDGINAKVNLVYNEDAAKLAENKAAYEKLLDKLAATGKLIRVSNFDIKYVNEKNLNVSASAITEEQRQKLADFYAYAIKAYMTKIPQDKQAGLCKANIVDTGDPVGLWSKNAKSDWVRTATYKAWCEALGGK